MKSFAIFMKNVEFLNQCVEDKLKLSEEQVARLRNLKPEFYGQRSDDEIRHMESRKDRGVVRDIEYGLEVAKFFELDDKTKKLLLLTNAPTSKETLKLVRLPFKAIYLDLSILREEANLGKTYNFANSDYSNTIHEAGVDKILGFLFTEKHEVSPSFDANNNTKKIGSTFLHSFEVFGLYEATKDGKVQYYIERTHITIDSSHEVKVMYTDKKMEKFIRSFLINFCLFINNPEVETIEIRRSRKNQERRAKQGKVVMPSSNVIKLTGSLKEYWGELEASGSFNYSHKFWVRGHWRRYKDEKRFKHMKGKAIWIAPFVKGKGVMIDKKYKIQKVEEE